MEILDEHRVYRVGMRKPLLLGCDRKLLMVVAVFSVTLVYAGFPSVWYVLFGGGLWFFTLPLMRKMAKADPFMTEKVVRHLVYIKQKTYLPHATPFAKARIYRN